MATNLTVGLFSNIYSQLDPLSMGEDHRDLHVALEYGARLASHSDNVNHDTVWRLVHDYPSHDFVIDYSEAKDLFKNVTRPNSDLYELLGLLDDLGVKPLTDEDGVFKFLSEEPEQAEVESVEGSTDAAEGERDDGAVQPVTEAADD